MAQKKATPHAGRVNKKFDKTLKQQIIEDYGYRIISGQLPAGTILQLEEVSKQLQISLTVVREAISVLASLGLVESRKRLGTVIQPFKNWNHISPLVIEWKFQDPAQRHDQFMWLMQVRSALEPEAAALTALSRSDEAAQKLISLAQELHDQSKDIKMDKFLATDIAFHQLVFEECSNPLMARMAQQIDSLLMARHRYGLMPKHPDVRAIGYHLALAKAISDKDVNVARQTSQLIVNQAAEETMRRSQPNP